MWTLIRALRSTNRVIGGKSIRIKKQGLYHLNKFWFIFVFWKFFLFSNLFNLNFQSCFLFSQLLIIVLEQNRIQEDWIVFIIVMQTVLYRLSHPRYPRWYTLLLTHYWNRIKSIDNRNYIFVFENYSRIVLQIDIFLVPFFSHHHYSYLGFVSCFGVFYHKTFFSNGEFWLLYYFFFEILLSCHFDIFQSRLRFILLA